MANLRVHTSCVHEAQRKYECEVCLMKFKSFSEVKRHLKTVHYSGGQNTTPQNKIVPTNEKLYKCDLCEKTFKSNSYLKGHKDKVHLRNKAMKCEECDKMYATKGILEVHIKSVHGKAKSNCDDG